jgi:hypothetical protein
MEITISSHEGENVIAQIIEDLLTINGLSVKRDEISPVFSSLTIDQLDRQISVLKKNGTVCNIKVISEARPKPKKTPKFKMPTNDLFEEIAAPAPARTPYRANWGNFDMQVAAGMGIPRGYTNNQPVEVAQVTPAARQGIADQMREARQNIRQAIGIDPQEVADEMPVMPAPQLPTPGIVVNQYNPWRR